MFDDLARSIVQGVVVAVVFALLVGAGVGGLVVWLL